MTSRFLVSHAACHRLAAAQEWLSAREPGEEVLLLAPHLDAADELLRVVGTRRGAAFGWHRATLRQVAATLAAPALAERGLVPVTRTGAQAVASRAVAEARANGTLGRFSAVAEGPGVPRAVARVVEELRLAQVSAAATAGVAPAVAHLYERYVALLADAGLADWAGVLELAIVAATVPGANGNLSGLPALWLDLPVDNAAEQTLLAALAARTPDLLATAPAGDAQAIDALEKVLGHAPIISDAIADAAQTGAGRDQDEQAIVDDGDNGDENQQAGTGKAAGGKQVDDTPPETVTMSLFDSVPDAPTDPDAAAATALQRMQQYLFSDEASPPEARLDESVSFFSAPGESRECVEIARRVLALARGGVAFDRMAILLRAPQTYRAHIAEAFSRAQIPLYFASGAVRPDSAGRALHALLACAAEGLSARRFAEYLSLGQMPDSAGMDPAAQDGLPAVGWIAPDEDLVPRAVADANAQSADAPAPHLGEGAGEGAAAQNPTVTPRRWERLLSEAAVIGGAQRWPERLALLREQTLHTLANLETPDDALAAALEQKVADIEAFEARALPLIAALAALPAAATWGEWITHIGSLLSIALCDSQRVLAVLSEFQPMAGCGPATLEEVRQILAERLLELPQPSPARRYGRVFVAPVDAVRGMAFDAVFIPGLAEKIFPGKISQEPMLLDPARATLDAGLITNQERVAAERKLLMLATGAANEQICLSYPRVDLEQSRPRVPSFYALETMRAAEGRLPDFAELAQRAEAVGAARIGWPAPSDAADAIDEAEHDLAVLQRILQLDGKEATGAAHYLLQANPHLGRALRFRARRWLRRWTAADGLVDPSPAAKAAMARHTLDQRSWSPTALQHFAACPYRFLLQAVHKLTPREVPEAIDELNPLQRGSLVHDVLFDLQTRLKEADELPVRPGNLALARAELDRVVDEVAAQYHQLLAPAIQRVWDDGIAGIRADLREWLRRASEDDSGYVPWRFELAFGLVNRPERGKTDPNSVPEPVRLDNGLQLRGSIDLVERNGDGHLRVTDYKTGKRRAQKGQMVAGGTSLQPVLYALVAEQMHRDGSHVDSGRLDYCTAAGGFSDHTVVLDQRGRDAADTIVATLAKALDEPFLPAAPAQGECRWCDYRLVCGPYEEQRSARKPQERLADLSRVRDLP